MQIRGALSATVAAQFYSATITLAIIPILISLVGAEAFGLIGFFLMTQVWLQLLDAGVSGSLARQLSIAKNFRKTLRKFFSQFRIVVVFYAIVSIAIVHLALQHGASFSEAWFDTTLSLDILSNSIICILLIFAAKYFSGPFRSGLIGLERHGTVALNTFLQSTLRYPGGALVLYYYSLPINEFFQYQLLVSVFEAVYLISAFWWRCTLSYQCANSGENTYDVPNLLAILKLSFTLSGLTVLWVLISQADKLLLSNVLSLSSFGYYSLAVSVSGVLLTLALPFSQVLMPRLSALFGSRDFASFERTLSTAALGYVVFTIPIALFIFFFGNEIILVWTASPEAAREAGRYVGWLALGNAAAVMMNIVFLFQLAMGSLKKHLIVYAAYSCCVLPVIVFVVQSMGAEAAAMLWCLHNVIFLAFWGGRVLWKHAKSLLVDILIPALMLTLLISYSFFFLATQLPIGSTRFSTTLLLVGIGLVTQAAVGYATFRTGLAGLALRSQMRSLP